jgi:sugar phosphate isomerase/epimerase
VKRIIQLGSADWNLWPISRDYDAIFGILKSKNIQRVELGIYQPSVELSEEKRAKIINAAARNQVEITAMLFSLTDDFWPHGAISNPSSGFLKESQFFLNALEEMRIRYANFWTGVDGVSADSGQVSQTIDALDALGDTFPGIISIEYKAETIFSNGATLAKFLSVTRNLKVLVDTGHAFALGEDIVQLLGDLHDLNLLGAMHLGDAVIGDSDADLPCGRIHDFSPIIRKLMEINFKHTVNFDLYGAATDESGPGPVAILEESVSYLEMIVKQIS